MRLMADMDEQGVTGCMPCRPAGPRVGDKMIGAPSVGERIGDGNDIGVNKRGVSEKNRTLLPYT